MLSNQGNLIANKPLRADFELFFQALENLYHPEENPDGDIPLCIAENLLRWEELRDKMQSIVATNTAPEWVASYTDVKGAPDFRTALASFLSRNLGGDALDPDSVAVAAGAAAVIENTALLLANPGDVAVIPAPTYGGYTPDLVNKAQMDLHFLHLSEPEGHPGTYNITAADLDKAHAELGDKFRMLILTQPNNPSGQVFTEDQIYQCITWCEERKIHCVVNEIYAMSLLNQDHPDLASDYEERQWFVSCLPQLQARNSDYFHWWWSFSKDFGISGLRMGVFYSRNKLLIQAWANYGAPSMSSNYTQWLLMELLNDKEWVDPFIRNNSAITDSYATVIRTLRKHNVPYLPAVGSLFVWFDLSAYLTADTDEAEEAIWRNIFDETGLLLTTPVGMHHPIRGWFRMVYSGVPKVTLEVAMVRLAQWLGSRK
jgi:aspartate/methionine/tyrosine aminotransferase